MSVKISLSGAGVAGTGIAHTTTKTTWGEISKEITNLHNVSFSGKSAVLLGDDDDGDLTLGAGTKITAAENSVILVAEKQKAGR